MLDGFQESLGDDRSFDRPVDSLTKSQSGFGPQQAAELNGPDLEHLLNMLSLSQVVDRYPILMSLYDLLIHSIVLLPVPPGTNIDEGVPLVALENGRGEKGVPVFTSEHAMSLWVTEPTEYVGIPFSLLCTHAVYADLDFILLNMSGPAGGEINHYEFAYLAEGLIPPPQGEQAGEITIEKNTEIRLAPLDKTPTMLVERLNGVFGQQGNCVAEAYMFKVGFSHGPLKTGLGIRLAPGMDSYWDQTVWPNVLVVLKEVLGAKEYINVFLLNDSPDLEKVIRQITPSFYSA